jgi:transposase
MEERISVGLDVSKLTVDACLLMPDGKAIKAKFPNNPAGFDRLLSWLHGIDRNLIHACLEPTGVYSRPLAKFLWSNGIRISQVNTYAVQCHGRSKNFRSKTDRIDCFLLADYCLKENPPSWSPPSQNQSELKEIQHRLACLDEQIRQEENRLEVVDSKLVRDDIEDTLGRLYIRRKRLEAAARQLIKSDEKIASNFAILNSIIGLGEKSAIRILALVQFEQFKENRQVACFAGLTPKEFSSGTSIHRKPQISRIGNPELRAALYFPAMVAIQHNPQMREFAERLRANNKPPKVIISAVMRKLLVLASTLLRKQQMYDPNYRSPLTVTT